ncbi:unnamed protein product [Arabidopsis arenosa]|uniref:ATP synthase protein MI25 n=1 Tax=Arabidopsis arenosa TaxID=38785 RepID=A0A8S2A4K8_ARAAE|nr:unnamed protein product [Arabidopsis arenosa]
MTGVFLFYGFGELLPIGSDSDVGEASWVVNPATGASGSGGAGGFNAASGSGGNGWSESAANDPAREVSLAPFPPQLTHPVPFPAEPGSPDPVSPPPPIASFYSQIERAESLHARNMELAEDLQRIQEMQRALEDERDPYRGRELAARIDWEVHKLEGKVARNRALDMVRDAQLNIWRQGLDQELHVPRARRVLEPYSERDALRAGLPEMRPFGEAKFLSGHQTLQLMRKKALWGKGKRVCCLVTLPAFQRCLEDGPDAAERQPGSRFPTGRGTGDGHLKAHHDLQRLKSRLRRRQHRLKLPIPFLTNLLLGGTGEIARSPMGSKTTYHRSPTYSKKMVPEPTGSSFSQGQRAAAPCRSSGAYGRTAGTCIRGILLNRRNIPIMSMPIESMLLAVNSNFLVFSVSSDDMMGQVFASLVPTVAAAESAIGLAIFVITFRVRGTTFKVTLDGRIQAIQEESQQFPNPNEVVPPESNEQQRLLRISLRICGTVVESLPMARCAPKCEKTVQALLCRNLNVKSATLTNATSSRRIRFQDDLVTKFYTLVGNQFAYSCISKAERVEFIRESLVVLRMPPRQFFPILIAAGKRLGSPFPEKAGALCIDYRALNKLALLPLLLVPRHFESRLRPGSLSSSSIPHPFAQTTNKLRKNELLSQLKKEYAASLLATDALESISAVVLSAQPVAGLVCVVNGFGGIRCLRSSMCQSSERARSRWQAEGRGASTLGIPIGPSRCFSNASGILILHFPLRLRKRTGLECCADVTVLDLGMGASQKYECRKLQCAPRSVHWDRASKGANPFTPEAQGKQSNSIATKAFCRLSFPSLSSLSKVKQLACYKLGSGTGEDGWIRILQRIDRNIRFLTSVPIKWEMGNIGKMGLGIRFRSGHEATDSICGRETEGIEGASSPALYSTDAMKLEKEERAAFQEEPVTPARMPGWNGSTPPFEVGVRAFRPAFFDRSSPGSAAPSSP